MADIKAGRRAEERKRGNRNFGKNKNTIFPTLYCYQIFCRYASELKGKRTNPLWVNNETYYRLMKRIHRKIVDRMIYEQYQWKIPHRLGKLFVAKKKPKITYDKEGNIDYNKTNLLYNYGKMKPNDKPVYHYNTHTKGYFMKFHWRKKFGEARVKNIGSYKIKLEVHHTRKLHKAIMELYTKGKIDFTEIKSKP